MKNTLLSILVILALALSACASHVYSVNMKNGDVFQAEGEPEYDRDSSTFCFTDTNGKTVRVNKDDVQAIRQVK